MVLSQIKLYKILEKEIGADKAEKMVNLLKMEMKEEANGIVSIISSRLVNYFGVALGLMTIIIAIVALIISMPK